MTPDISQENPRLYPLLLSAPSGTALDGITRQLLHFLEQNPGVDLAALAHALQAREPHYNHRRFLPAHSPAETIEALTAILTPAGTGGRKVKSYLLRQENPPAVFMFAGIGSQYTGMGLDLFREEPGFRSLMRRGFDILNTIGDDTPDLESMLYPELPAGAQPGSGDDLSRFENAQLAVFLFEYALGSLLIEWGITPRAMIGYSLGEYAAACLAGVFDLETALRLVIARGKLTRQVPAGSMLSVPLDLETLSPLLDDFIHRRGAGGGTPVLAVAIDNGPSCVVAGADDDVDAFEQDLKGRRFMCMRVQNYQAIHSPVMEPILEPFEKTVARFTLAQPRLPYISNVTGAWITPEQAVSPRYWAQHLGQTVRFAEGMRQLAGLRGARFIEIGPGHDLSALAQRYASAEEPDQKILNLVRHPGSKVNDLQYLLRRMGLLWLYGVPVDWTRAGGITGEPPLSLPLDVHAFAGDTPGEAPVEPPPHRPEVNAEYAAPTNPMEHTLVEFFQQTFGGGPPIGIDDNFFELGGDSIKASSIATSITRQMNVTVPISRFFKTPSIRNLARYIDGQGGEDNLTIEPAEKKDVYPTSSSQRRIHIYQNMHPGIVAYNMPTVVELDNIDNPRDVEDLYRRLIRRHDSFRTSFHFIGGQSVQRVHDTVDFSVEYFDPGDTGGSPPPGWATGTGAGTETMVQNFVRPFDLSVPPLLRVGLIKTGPRRYLLMLDLHHVIADGFSTTVLATDTAAFSRGTPPGELELQFKDYSEWENSPRGDKAIRQQESYWFKEFDQQVQLIELPTDFPRPERQTFEGDGVLFEIGGQTLARMKDMMRDKNVTLFMMLLAVYTILLSKVCHQEDIVIGTSIHGRRQENLKHIIGMFVKTLVLRNHPTGQKTFTRFLEEVKIRTLDAFENQDYPFENIVDHVMKKRDMTRNPLADVALVLQNYEKSDTSVDNVKAYSAEMKRTRLKCDLTLSCGEAGDKLLFSLSYSVKLFKEKTIRDFTGYFKKILAAALDNPGIKLSQIALGLKQEDAASRPPEIIERTAGKKQARGRLAGMRNKRRGDR